MPKTLKKFVISLLCLFVSSASIAEDNISKEEVKNFLINFTKVSCSPNASKLNWTKKCKLTFNKGNMHFETLYTKRNKDDVHGWFGVPISTLNPLSGKYITEGEVHYFSFECTNAAACVLTDDDSGGALRYWSFPTKTREQAERLIRAYSTLIALEGGKPGAF